jgi:hypothetical protein
MSGWELAFVEKIQSIRRREAKEIQSANRLKAWNEAIFFATNVTVSVVIFLVQVLTGGELRTRDVFTTFSLINIVQLTMTKFFSFAVMVCQQRLAKLFQLSMVERILCSRVSVSWLVYV